MNDISDKDVIEKILGNILSSNDVRALLEGTDMPRLLELEERLVALEDLIPPVRDLLPIIHACIFEKSGLRKGILLDSIKKKGFLQRVWRPNEALRRKTEEFFLRIKKTNLEEVLGGYILALYEYLFEGNDDGIYIALFIVSNLLASSIEDILCSGIYPVANIDSVFEKSKKVALSDKDRMLAKIIDSVYELSLIHI